MAVIAATGGTVSARAAKAATSTIPIVFNVGEDPIGSGLVASFNRPGSNATGVNTLSPALESKRLDLLHELVPHTTLLALLLNPNNPDSEVQRQEVQAATAAVGQSLIVFEASNQAELEKAFVSLVGQGAGALIVGNDVFFINLREDVTQLALRYSVPAVYAFRQFSETGGLMSYSTNLFDVYHQIGIYVARILDGEKSADLPVVQPTKYELVINLKTAKILGLDIPPSLLARADEVIE